MCSEKISNVVTESHNNCCSYFLKTIELEWEEDVNDLCFTWGTLQKHTQTHAHTDRGVPPKTESEDISSVFPKQWLAGQWGFFEKQKPVETHRTYSKSSACPLPSLSEHSPLFSQLYLLLVWVPKALTSALPQHTCELGKPAIKKWKTLNECICGVFLSRCAIASKLLGVQFSWVPLLSLFTWVTNVIYYFF